VSFMTLMTVTLLMAVTGLFAFTAVILYEWMGFLAGLLLADNGQMCVAAARNIDSTSWGPRTSAQHKAASMISITIPVIDPALAIRPGALISEGGGVEEVVNVDLG